MKKIISLITSVFLLMLFTNTVFSAGDEENLSLLGSFKKTDAAMGESIPQDTKFAENVRKNIIPNIKMPAGFKIELFAVAPDARHMAVSRSKGAVMDWDKKRQSMASN